MHARDIDLQIHIARPVDKVFVRVGGDVLWRGNQ